MKGFVPTPSPLVDLMVEILFRAHPPSVSSTVLDPGCGRGAFIEGIVRWCAAHESAVPRIDGIESNPTLVRVAKRKLSHLPSVRIEHRDFLTLEARHYDFAIGNPPYVPITDLREAEKTRFRRAYATAKGRFDLYMLFFEKALSQLRPGGRLCFVTPEKFMYVETAGPLRALLSRHVVEEVRFLGEQTFGDLVTYPTVTTVTRAAGPAKTLIMRRNGSTSTVRLPLGGSSWQPLLQGVHPTSGIETLSGAALRVSCGVATGADAVFVFKENELPADLRPWSFPTLAGRELVVGEADYKPMHRLVMPYDRQGRLLPLANLGALGSYLSRPEIRSRLERRTCARRKPWYSFHETPPMAYLLRPKILCKDITSRPQFWIDRKGSIIPRHSVYYIVPRDSEMLDPLCDYLNSPPATQRLGATCQRATNDFLRLQSTNLKAIPLPAGLSVQPRSRVSAPTVGTEKQVQLEVPQ